MTLTPGTTLGPYEIQALLGAGGMGEVYKANDNRLHRSVAIKVLREIVASHSELRQRFEREARAVAALSHPHICTLHDIGSEDGIDFLVMEYLEGETLAQRLAKGALPLDQALKIAVEIAAALDKAHRQGIVHRDLKPGNIMLTKAGAKLLDFGLAKLKAVEQAVKLTALPTQAVPLTSEGAILGTFQYMAPEQLEGKEADTRTDIFTFGAVVYEIVTGKKAFEGESRASLMGAIMSSDPPSLASLQPLTPAVLENVVNVCLAKDPDQRWQDVSDVGRQLQWIAEDGSDDGTDSALVTSTTEPSAKTTRWTITLPESYQVPHRGGRVAVSSDGQTVVYSADAGEDADAQLFRRPIDQFGAIPMMHTEGARDPFFSPDGQWVGFFAHGALRKVALAGGAAQKLTELPQIRHSGLRGAIWGTDDMILMGILGGARCLVQIPAAGGEPGVIVKPEGDEMPWYPQVLPRTGAILFTLSEMGPDAGELQVLLTETGERRSVLPNAVAGRVLETGHLVFVRSGALWAAPIDQERLEIVGNPVPVVDGVSVGPGGEVQYAVADTGTLVYVPGAVAEPWLHERTTLALVDRQGSVENLPVPLNEYAVPRFSPDGTRIAAQISSGDGSNIFIFERSNNRLRQLTFDGGERPIWTPDGAQITFLAKNALWNITSDFSEEPQLLSTDDEEFRIVAPLSWSPDGRVLLLAVWPDAGMVWGVAQLARLEDGGVEYGPVLVEQKYHQGWANFSADGRWFAFATFETGVPEVYIKPWPPGAGAKRRITHGGGNYPVWSRNGRELFYVHDGKLWAMGIETEPTLDWQDPVALFEVPGVWPWVTRINYDVTSDGQKFVFLMPEKEESYDRQRQINVVLNWFEELKRLVPTEN